MTPTQPRFTWPPPKPVLVRMEPRGETEYAYVKREPDYTPWWLGPLVWVALGFAIGRML